MNRIFFFAVLAIIMSGCSSAEGDFAGSEYMPDMGHSIAFEANHYDYYYHNTWGTEDEYYKYAQPRKPVAGTIPRGDAGAQYAMNATAQRVYKNNMSGAASHNAIAIPANGSVPYYYKDTEEDRLRATADMIGNPYPITTEGLARGGELYDIYCGICHGKKGDGNGYLVADENPNAVYPAQPAILTNDEFTAASNGRYYHAIMHGKNVMGGYADKLSYEERWQVIHYIRSLQAKNKKLAYDQDSNTLNSVEVPGNSMKVISANMSGGGGGTLGATAHGNAQHNAAGGTMLNAHSATGHGATHTTQGGHTTIGGAVGGAVDGAVQKANEVIEGAANKIEGAATEAEKKGGKLKEKLKNAGGKIKEKVQETGGKIKDAFKKDKNEKN